MPEEAEKKRVLIEFFKLFTKLYDGAKHTKKDIDYITFRKLFEIHGDEKRGNKGAAEKGKKATEKSKGGAEKGTVEKAKGATKKGKEAQKSGKSEAKQGANKEKLKK